MSSNNNTDNEVKNTEQAQGLKIISTAETQSKSSSDHCFKVGQTLSYVRVRFPGHNKSFPFYTGEKTYKYGQQVVAPSDRGITVGYINSFTYKVKFHDSLLPIQTIIRVANKEDIAEQKENYRKEKEAEMTCKKLVEKYKLDMDLTHVELTQYGKKCVFYFTAPARVDFRSLVKELVDQMKVRVELRQISVRDRAAAVGGIGDCGRQLCCSAFLEKYGSVNLKMAKNQNLTINFDQLNGVCGQIKCCIKYEDRVYQEKRKRLPPQGKSIKCFNGDEGVVEELLILTEQFTIVTKKGVRKRYVAEQFEKLLEKKLPGPKEFDHIRDERSQVVGLEEHKIQSQDLFDQEVEKIQGEAKGFAAKVFSDLFGVESFEQLLEEN